MEQYQANLKNSQLWPDIWSDDALITVLFSFPEHLLNVKLKEIHSFHSHLEWLQDIPEHTFHNQVKRLRDGKSHLLA